MLCKFPMAFPEEQAGLPLAVYWADYLLLSLLLWRDAIDPEARNQQITFKRAQSWTDTLAHPNTLPLYCSRGWNNKATEALKTSLSCVWTKCCREIVSNLKCTVQPWGYKQEPESHKLPWCSQHPEAHEEACALPSRCGDLKTCCSVFLCTILHVVNMFSTLHFSIHHNLNSFLVAFQKGVGI